MHRPFPHSNYSNVKSTKVEKPWIRYCIPQMLVINFHQHFLIYIQRDIIYCYANFRLSAVCHWYVNFLLQNISKNSGKSK